MWTQKILIFQKSVCRFFITDYYATNFAKRSCDPTVTIECIACTGLIRLLGLTFMQILQNLVCAHEYATLLEQTNPTVPHKKCKSTFCKPCIYGLTLKREYCVHFPLASTNHALSYFVHHRHHHHHHHHRSG